MGYTVYIILVPMVMFLFIGLGSKWLRPRAAGLCGTLGMAVSALLSYLTAYRYFFVEGLERDAYRALTAWSAQWLRFSDTLHIDMGVLLDPISVMMLVVITTVSLMVHIYSFGYMKGERGFQRYSSASRCSDWSWLPTFSRCIFSGNSWGLPRICLSVSIIRSPLR